MRQAQACGAPALRVAPVKTLQRAPTLRVAPVKTLQRTRLRRLRRATCLRQRAVCGDDADVVCREERPRSDREGNADLIDDEPPWPAMPRAQRSDSRGAVGASRGGSITLEKDRYSFLQASSTGADRPSGSAARTVSVSVLPTKFVVLAATKLDVMATLSSRGTSVSAMPLALTWHAG